MKGVNLLACFLLVAAFFLDGFVSVKIEVEHLPEKCGFASCPAVENSKLNVHLVPHTHDDVGWLKTVDQYYYGANNTIWKAGVQYILDSVVQALVRNKERKFIYVETAFFSKWWLEQDVATQEIVQELVRTGQLEFISGGWCMNDEATTHYSSIIDQMTLGLRFLNDTFGHCATPRVAWQIDPFGHSREQANLFAQMNYDGLFFSRIDFQDRTFRETRKTMEHIWHGSDDLGTSADLFTSVISPGYGPPNGFNWDLLGGSDDPVIDNPDSEEYNVDNIVARFVAVSEAYALNYSTNQIMFTMGEDFHYQTANILYKNMDKLIKHVNKRQTKVKVFYSTPSCYLKAIHDLGTVFKTKSDDFFPYASDPTALWTGYFTSRPALKRMERVGNNWLQACKQIDVLAGNDHKMEPLLRKLKEAMGVMQHHDAVSGTEKQHVANDYAKLLQIGLDQCKVVINDGLKQLSSHFHADRIVSDYQFCDLTNTSACYASETYRNLLVTLYNPFGHTLHNYTARLPIVTRTDEFIEVLDQARQPLQATLFPLPDWVKAIPGRTSRASHELVFDVKIAPLGFVSLFIERSYSQTDNSAVEASQVTITKAIVLKQGKRKIFFDKEGALERISLPDQTISLQNNFFYYEGHTGNNRAWANRSSGAYIFRPKEQTPVKVGKLLRSVVFFDARRHMYEIQQTYDSFTQQSLRIHPNKDYIEVDWFVDSIPISNGVGKEVVVKYTTNLKSNGTFYTDANGRQVLKRIRNYRPTWNYTVYEPVSGNYYPVNSRIFIRDTAAQLTILTDRSQGGTSMEDGQVEIMLHRRLLHDDAFGVDEALNETGSDGRGLVVRGRHFLQFGTVDSAAQQHRQLSQQLYLEPIIAFMPKFNLRHYPPGYRTFFSGLAKQLPPNVHLLTLEQWRAKQILVRLEHFYQSNEDPVLSKLATVQLDIVLPGFNIRKIEELTLGANQDIGQTKRRLKFKYRNEKEKDLSEVFTLPTNGTITLAPMQIRTFILTL